MGNEKDVALIFAVLGFVLGGFLLLIGIEVWTILGTTRYVITDIGYLGIIGIVIGVVFLLAYFFIKPDTSSFQYGKTPPFEQMPPPPPTDRQTGRRAIRTCPNCGMGIDEDWLKCPRCKTVINKKCPQCEKISPVGFRACPYCGLDFPE